jgi:hypothetical protein
MALQTDVAEHLRNLDQILASNDPTVWDAFKQAVVLSKVAAQDSVLTGPLEKMFWELQEMRREIDQLKVESVNRERGTYWSPNTYDHGRNYGNWGITTPNDKTVVAASPTDLDAFTMFDPDTGDSISVKYK